MRVKIFLSISFSILSLFIAMIISLTTFSGFNLELYDIYETIFHYDNDNLKHNIIYSIRMPRYIGTLVFGASFACAGMIIQSILQNPIASPNMLGIVYGATMGIAFSVLLSIEDKLSMMSFAFLGSLVTWCIVMIAGNKFLYKKDRFNFILIGIAVSGFCRTFTKILVIIAEDTTKFIFEWIAGSFSVVTWDALYVASPLLILSLLCTLLLSKTLDAFALGDEYVVNFGVDIKKALLISSILILLLTALSVSAVGSISFVGLLAPNVARAIVGIKHIYLLPTSIFVGAILCSLGDSLSRAFLFPAEIPGGLIIAIIGSSYYIFLSFKILKK